MTFFIEDQIAEVKSGIRNEITVYGERLYPEGLKALTDALRANLPIYSVVLPGCHLEDHGTAAIVDALRHNTTVQSLDVSSNDIGEDGMEKLRDLLEHSSTLRALNIGGNPLSTASIETLAEGIRANQSLEALNIICISSTNTNTKGPTSLEECHTLDDAADTLFAALAKHPRLRIANLSTNGLAAATMQKLAEAFEGHPHLTCLRAANNYLDKAASDAWLRTIEHTPSLTEFALTPPNTVPAFMEKIADVIAKRPDLASIDLGHSAFSIGDSERLAHSIAPKTFTSLISVEPSIPALSPIVRRNRAAAKHVVETWQAAGVEGFTAKDAATIHRSLNGVVTYFEDEAEKVPFGDAQRLKQECTDFLTRFPTLEPSTAQPVDKDALLIRNNHGFCILENPHIWQEFTQWASHLSKLTKADLLEPSCDGVSYLELAAANGVLEEALTHLAQRGEYLGKQDLVGADGAPSSLLEAVIDEDLVPALFQNQILASATARSASELFHAIPKGVQEKVKNFHELVLQLQRRDNHHAQAVQKGRG